MAKKQQLGFFKKVKRDKQIMQERLPVGLIAIIGPQGAGKTSNGVAWMCNDFKYHGKKRFSECEAYTDALNSKGFNLHLPKNKCLYFSPDIEILSKRPYVETWYVNPEFVELPNLKNVNVQYFPRYSVVHLPEFDNLINCRDWKNMSPYLVALAKYARHWDLTIIIDFQAWLEMDASWRRLMMYTVFMLGTWNDSTLWQRLFHILQKQYWKYLLVNNQLNSFCSDLNSTMVDKKIIEDISRSVAVVKQNVFKGFIFNRYKSTSGEAYFLNGIQDYVFVPHKPYPMTPEGVKEYCASHPLRRSK